MSDYITIAQLKAAIDPNGEVTWSAADDANLQIAIDAAELWIDEVTGVHWVGQTQTRTYTARHHDVLYVDELLSVTTLKTDDDHDGVYETTWTTDDYRLKPSNATADGRPYTWIEPTAWGDYSFPKDLEDGIQVAGMYGASAAAPGPIVQAALLVAHRLWLRNQHIFGRGRTSAQLALTFIRADDDVAELLERVYSRLIYG